MGLLIVLIIVCAVAFAQHRSFNNRREWAQKIVQTVDYQSMFDSHLHGVQAFDDAATVSIEMQSAIDQYDKNIESRLFTEMAKTLPSWVLKSIGEDINQGRDISSNSAFQYVDQFFTDIAANRAQNLMSRMNQIHRSRD